MRGEISYLLAVVAAFGCLVLLTSLIKGGDLLDKNPGVSKWTQGALLSCLGFVLLTLRGHVPDLIGIVTADALFVIGFVQVYNGFRIYCGFPGRPRQGLVLVSAALACFLYFTYWQPSSAARLAVIALSDTVIGLGIALLLLRARAAGTAPRLHKVLLAAFTTTGVLAFAVAVAAILLPTQADGTQDASGVLIALMGAVAALVIVVAIVLPLEILTRARDSLAESEKRYRSMFQTNPSPVSISRMSDGTLLDVNAAFARAIDAPRSAILGRTWTQLGIWADPEDHQRLCQRLAAAGECLDFETRLVRRDGTRLDCNVAASRIELDRHACMLLVAHDETGRRLAERTLREQEEFFRLIAENIGDFIAVLDLDGRRLYNSPSYDRFFGSASDLHGSDSFVEVHPEDQERVKQVFRETVQTGIGQTIEYRFRLADGSIRQMESHGGVIKDSQGRVKRVVVVSHDISERKRTETLLRESERHFRALANGGSTLIWTSCQDKRCNYFNEPWLRFTGKSLEQELGDGWLEGVHPDDRALCLGTYSSAFDQRKAFSIDYRIRHADGSYRWIRDDGNPRYDSQGGFLGYIGFCVDVTPQKEADEKIKTLAFYDFLTGLPNRRLLQDRLEKTLAASSRHLRQGALLFIDLDNFKTLNDTLGHDMGDLLLQQVAQRLAACVRESDTVARLGGDEFVVMLEDLSQNPQEAAARVETVGEKIITKLNQNYQLSGCEYRSTPSIGVTLFAGNEEPFDELLKRADLAMYQAKVAGRNTMRFFDPEMQAAVTSRTALEAGLREALRKDQFLLHYQAQVDRAGRLTGSEVLLRWQHPERGIVSPAEFIPLAEETRLILPLGQWVLQTACSQLAGWAAKPEMARLTLAVNVSAHQFNQPDFVEQVLATLDGTGADPRRLRLELTESLLVHNAQEIIEKMFALKARGVGFSLDDFGTGYSSLSYLKRMPLEQLKIDQSFVRDVLSDPNAAAIARTIVALGQNLGLGVIAEGVETELQRDFLVDSGCHAYQGYFFSRPVPAGSFERFAQRLRHLPTA